MIRLATMYFAAWQLAMAVDVCLDDVKVEEIEESEIAEMQTELLQVKLKVQQRFKEERPPREPTPVELAQAVAEAASTAERTFYGKVLEESPFWCGYIKKIVQYLVPPCWFGSPDIVQDGPGSNPSWCQYVHDRSEVAACHPVLVEAAAEVVGTVGHTSLGKAQSIPGCFIIQEIISWVVPHCWHFEDGNYFWVHFCRNLCK
eukprot:TRINITY_DN79401_c0_g1_i1.p1 TRINITY_DN79401_c0_g1~~TRINITY_DN79401_c0_g1_i1.p1  ORF type:complete len:233 (-),score=32.39 TRINITY_DN79401_c0_g1_i1:221-826(-)